MPEQNDAQNPTEHIGSQPDPTPSRSPKKTEVVPGAHTANHGEENPKADKAKWTDITMAFFTVLLVVVAVAQAFIFYRQWDEMHSGGVDTHTLAEVAKSQADAAKSQAEEAKAQVDKMSESLTKTDKLISEATTQATATNKLATQAQRSADFAQEAIKTSIDAERPWVGVGQFNVANFTEGQTAKLSINFINSGKRPASATVIYGVVISPSLQQFPMISAARESSVAFILPGGSFGSTLDYDVPPVPSLSGSLDTSSSS